MAFCWLGGWETEKEASERIRGLPVCGVHGGTMCKLGFKGGGSGLNG